MLASHNPLVDLHVNGVYVPEEVSLPSLPASAAKVVSFSGADLTLEYLKRATERLVSQGTDFFLATLISTAPETILQNLALIAKAMKEPWGKPILGVHLETPFLSPECKGAHPLEFIKSTPDLGLFKTFFEAADGNIVLTTTSPALPGAPTFIEQLCDLGVTVSLGHHNASAQQIEEAFFAGATGVTHSGNAWNQNPDKEGLRGTPVMAQLLGKNAYVMVIPDGEHVSDFFIKYTYKIVENDRPGHIIWVSDCSALATAPVGTVWEYDGQKSTVMEQAGVVKPVPLSGSYLLLKDCLEKLRTMNVVPAEGIRKPASQNALQFVSKALNRCGTHPCLGEIEPSRE
jgi:N-acetylglucosamine-6-phosphate deacetylase